MRSAFGRLLRAPQGALGLGLIALLAIAVAIGPEVAPYSPEEFHFGARLAPPSAEFLLGTDQFGRDILSRLLWGSRATILLGLAATLLGATAGLAVGLFSGYVGGAVDEAVMRVVDALLAIPGLLFALLIVTMLGASDLNAMLAIGVAFAPGMARVARSVTLSARNQDYVSAAVARGESAIYVMVREILPNVLSPVIVEATIRVAFAIMLLATLSFLGLGAQPPTPEWGLMIAEAREFMFKSAWTVVWPGLAIAFVAMAFNLFGDGLRDALNPRRGG